MKPMPSSSIVWRPLASSDAAAVDAASFILALRLGSATLCCLGILDLMDFMPVLPTMGRRRLSSSSLAETRGTEEMLDFCGEHGIAAEAINGGFRRLLIGKKAKSAIAW